MQTLTQLADAARAVIAADRAGALTDDLINALAQAVESGATEQSGEAVNQQLLAALKAVNEKFISRPYGTGSYITKDVRDMVAAAIAAAPETAPAAPGLYAILYRDNWDGEGDTYHLLAECKDGKWYAEDSGKELLKYEGDAILHVWPLISATASQQPAPAMAQVELDVIANLVELARVITLAMDDSEERCGDEGRVHLIDSDNFDEVCGALDKLDELPDDKPGYTLGPAGKAEWALRRLLSSTPATSEDSSADQPAPAVPEGWQETLSEAAHLLELFDCDETASDVRALLAAAPQPAQQVVAGQEGGE